MEVRTPEDMRALGSRLSAGLRAGDVLVLSGDLGAGKTTFVQGLAAGLHIVEQVTSPTFVIARSYRGDQALVHVDAYRLGSALELEDLDLDADLEEAITVVEWGAGKVERIAPQRLVLQIDIAADASRIVTAEAVGDRWSGFDLEALA